jgi:hypothetical protein
MPNTINASTTSTTGLVQTADGSGILQLQSDGTTGLTISSGGKVVLANTALSTASAGTLEYDGGELYFTPLSTQRGLVSSAQYFRLDSALVGSNVNTAQSILGVGVTLSSNTIYHFEGVYALSKTAGATSHTTSLLYGGTATINNVAYWLQSGSINTTTFTDTANGVSFQYYIQTLSSFLVNGAQAAATTCRLYKVNGTISVNTGGTLIPQYQLSAAPGGAYTTAIGSYFSIWPVGAAGSNVSIGTWA